jgi:hypothetical protein
MDYFIGVDATDLDGRYGKGVIGVIRREGDQIIIEYMYETRIKQEYHKTLERIKEFYKNAVFREFTVK